MWMGTMMLENADAKHAEELDVKCVIGGGGGGLEP
jgi:hypothetical protein